MSVEHLRGLLDKVTDGPWWSDPGTHHGPMVWFASGDLANEMPVAHVVMPLDAEFIAEARNAFPDLLALYDAAPKNLACQTWPEKVALPPDLPVCGKCQPCRFNAALARLDNGEDDE